jgi:hypothetical protein
MLNTGIVRSGLFKHNAYVKAWCLVSNHNSSSVTQYGFSEKNFIDGHNLYIDAVTQTQASTSGVLALAGAIKFSFVNPMPDTNYKIFVQPYFPDTLVSLAHALNSPQYPKTRDSFWIRSGYFATDSTPAAPETGRTNNQLVNRRVWGNATFSIGVLVI